MNSKLKLLAVASKGGHWEQLMLLSNVLEAYESSFATTSTVQSQYRIDGEFWTLPDCNKSQPIRSFWCFLSALILIARVKPDVVVSTGAAPGLFCILAGRLFGARTLWIDSIANAERLSRCGAIANHVAHNCLTQWPHLAGRNGPQFAGAVL